GRPRQLLRLRVSQPRHPQACSRIRKRSAPAPDCELGNSLPGAVGSQALSNNLVSVEHRCLTPAFSGAANGTRRTIRRLLRGLRCNALLDGVIASKPFCLGLNPYSEARSNARSTVGGKSKRMK